MSEKSYRAHSVWQSLRDMQERRMREAAEATVALSHAEDCGCHVCTSVKSRSAAEK